MVERFHRTIDASLMAYLGNNPNRMEELPVALLDLCTAFKENLGCSCAEFIYDTHVRLPVDFFFRHQEH